NNTQNGTPECPHTGTPLVQPVPHACQDSSPPAINSNNHQPSTSSACPASSNTTAAQGNPASSPSATGPAPAAISSDTCNFPAPISSHRLAPFFRSTGAGQSDPVWQPKPKSKNRKSK